MPTIELRSVSGDPAVGSSQLATFSGAMYQQDLAVVLESDLDEDGFGDDSQETVPGTRITKRPASRLNSSRARFGFVATEAGSTFKCRLKGDGLPAKSKQFRSCTSPRKYKRLDPGRYRFQVRATSPSGNTDPTPARDKFKVVG